MARSYTAKKKYVRKTYKKKKNFRPAIRKVVYAMAEKKSRIVSFGTVAAAAALTATWVPISFFAGGSDTDNIRIGTGSNQRIGSKIFVTSIEYRFTIKPTAGAGMDASGGNQCRFVIYHNKQCNGALPTVLQIFNTNTVNSLRNQDFTRKISLLRDSIMSHSPTSSTTVVPAYPIVGFIPINKVVTFSTDAAGIAPIINDDWGFAVISDLANCCEFYGEFMVRYTDA